MCAEIWERRNDNDNINAMRKIWNFIGHFWVPPLRLLLCSGRITVDGSALSVDNSILAACIDCELIVQKDRFNVEQRIFDGIVLPKAKISWDCNSLSSDWLVSVEKFQWQLCDVRTRLLLKRQEHFWPQVFSQWCFKNRYSIHTNRQVVNDKVASNPLKSCDICFYILIACGRNVWVVSNFKLNELFVVSVSTISKWNVLHLIYRCPVHFACITSNIIGIFRFVTFCNHLLKLWVQRNRPYALSGMKLCSKFYTW